MCARSGTATKLPQAVVMTVYIHKGHPFHTIRASPMNMNLDALIFVPALAGSVICGMIFVCFMAHHYLTILESTAAGGREVTWMPESFLEFFWKAWYLGWLLGLCYVPAYGVARLIAPADTERWLFVALALWVLFPIAQLSSLSAPSPWYPLSVSALNRMARQPQTVLGFYLLSLPLLGLLAVAWYGSFLQSGFLLGAVAGAFLLVLGLFLYARLLGRLAAVLNVVQPLVQRRRKKKRRPAREDLATVAQASLSKASPPPRLEELPPVHTPLDGAIHGYPLQDEGRPSQPASAPSRLMAEIVEEEDDSSAEITPSARSEPGQRTHSSRFPSPDIPRHRARTSNSEKGTPTPVSQRERSTPRRTARPLDEDDTPYSVQSPEVTSSQVAPPELLRPSPEEMRLRRRDDIPPSSRRLWNPDLFAFLSQPRTLSAWLLSSSFGVVLVLLIRLARAFQPVGDA
jgi:hypothetical protein